MLQKHNQFGPEKHNQFDQGEGRTRLSCSGEQIRSNEPEVRSLQPASFSSCQHTGEQQITMNPFCFSPQSRYEKGCPAGQTTPNPYKTKTYPVWSYTAPSAAGCCSRWLVSRRGTQHQQLGSMCQEQKRTATLVPRLQHPG
jgi:hypothetical protein